MTIGKILALLIERSIVISLLRLNASIKSSLNASGRSLLSINYIDSGKLRPSGTANFNGALPNRSHFMLLAIFLKG